MTETEIPWYDQVALPALLRHARTAYGTAMRHALEQAGYDDIPGNGLYVIGGMAMGENGLPLGQLILELGVSKQAAGQLVDALVLRGYLERRVDEEDRRRLTVSLTERGQAAAMVQAEARARVDEALLASVGAESVAHTRRALAVLCQMGRRSGEAGEEG